MDLTVKTAPTETTIDAALVKANKRITHSSEDTLIDFWIPAADALIEKMTNRALLSQTLVLRTKVILPEIQIPRPPLADIEHVKITPEDEAEQTLADSDYELTSLNGLALLTLADYDRPEKGVVEIEYVAGHATAEDVPGPLRQATLLLVSHWLTSREAAFMDPRVMNIDKKIPFGVDELCKAFRIPNVDVLNEAG